MLKSILGRTLTGLLAVAVMAAYAGQGCSGEESNPTSSTADPVDNTNDPGPTSNTVQITNFSFSPSTITISVGETVTWRNNDATGHTVTSDTGDELESGLLSQGSTYSHTFNTTGTYSYHCTPHPQMKGTVIVQ